MFRWSESLDVELIPINLEIRSKPLRQSLERGSLIVMLPDARESPLCSLVEFVGSGTKM
jgi:hypothetical protein